MKREIQLCKECGREYKAINIDTLFLCPDCFKAFVLKEAMSDLGKKSWQARKGQDMSALAKKRWAKKSQ